GLAVAWRQLASICIYNVEINSAEHIHNFIKNGKKYNCIYISEVVNEDEIDESLLGLLDTGGRLIFFVRTSIVDKAYLITKT
ncbi:protein-L-isoaspartate O-methyltransferase, partial [Francisella tularensis subsp. holarctica]|nr:protein-L-isoaspartate O-methyltransferase [Francisella tularensis subsp. holarctica]